MLPVELEDFLHRHIPLSKAMGVSVASVDEDAVVLRAPLAPNINHRGTVFGGSVSAVAMLAGWSLLHTRLAAAGLRPRLVIRRNTMEYQAPITGDFVARASIARIDEWQRFIATLEHKGRARIAVSATLEHGDQVVATFAGEFVAFEG